jgi:hypothetical protein
LSTGQKPVRQVIKERNRTDANRMTRNSNDTSFERRVLFAERVQPTEAYP